MPREDHSLPEIPPSRADDLHNLQIAPEADLVLFMAGNQFMVMKELLDEFQTEHPEVEQIFYETLPPGLELKQILAGGATFQGGTVDVMPDVYTTVSEAAMSELLKLGLIEDFEVYLHNRLVLLVRAGNPLGIRRIADLGLNYVRVSQPGDLEDITAHVKVMYERAGGQRLLEKIIEGKRAEGTTLLTVVHHRETVLRLLKGTADVGPVWATEAMYARAKGLEVEAVEVGEPLDQRGRVNYYATRLLGAKNPTAGDAFLSFLKSPKAQEIYQSYGFMPHFG